MLNSSLQPLLLVSMLLIELSQTIALYRLLDVLSRELMSVEADRLEGAVKAAGLSLPYFSPSFGS